MKTPQELREAKKEKRVWYQQKFGDLSLMHNIEVCFECDCRGGKVRRHSRAHAHVDERKICIAYPPDTYGRLLTALHEMGHIVACRGDYKSHYTRAEAEYRATEWAYAEMRELGLPIKRKYKARYDAYIRDKIARAVRRGFDPSNLPKFLKQL